MGKSYTYQSSNFAAKVVLDKNSNRKRLEIAAPLYYSNAISKLDIGEDVSILVTSKKPKRTEAQNNYWWGVYLPQILAEGKGCGSSYDTHEDFARKYLTIKEWVNDRGQICYTRKSTSDLNVSEFNEFIVQIESDTGVVAPPTENFGLTKLLR